MLFIQIIIVLIAAGIILALAFRQSSNQEHHNLEDLFSDHFNHDNYAATGSGTQKPHQ